MLTYIFENFNYSSFILCMIAMLKSISFPGKYPGYGWSRVYACKPKPHRGWVLNLILSTLSREMNVALLYRRYCEKEASYLSEILPASCFGSA